MRKKKCVLVGTGERGTASFIGPIAKGHLSDICEMCGLYDAVKGRALYVSERYNNIPVFDDFDTMLDTVKPDYVIVTTKDSTHHEYIIRALDKGYDVVSEKPMTNSRKKALEIMEAEKRSGHTVRVAFNLRYMRPFEDLKRAIMSGAIGEVRHIDLSWLLDRHHGADYFRRWHRYLDNSTSLLIHKATHHFDLINWFIGKRPLSVYANCTLEFYGKNGPFRGKACHLCDHAAECPLFWDITKSYSYYVPMYHNLIGESGYYRDGCVFAEDIDIFDRMALQVKYEDGITMNYSLVAYAPEEGYRFRIIGTKGTIEFEAYSSGPRTHTKVGTTFADEIAAEKHPELGETSGTMAIRILPADGEERIVVTGISPGGHGGADIKMLNDIFRAPMENDPLVHRAPSIAGYYSLAIGDMAVASSKAGRPVTIDEFVE